MQLHQQLEQLQLAWSQTLVWQSVSPLEWMVDQRRLVNGVLVTVARKCAESLLDCIASLNQYCNCIIGISAQCMCLSIMDVLAHATNHSPLGPCRKDIEDSITNAIRLQPQTTSYYLFSMALLVA